MKEIDVQRAVLKWLHSKDGVMAWRQNNGSQYDMKIGGYRSFSGLKGIPDIIAVMQVDGFNVTMWVEVKHKSRQSADQILFQKRVEHLGGFYFVVKNVDDIEKAYEKTVQDMQKRIQNKAITRL